jgi:3-oxoacyl-[acyl-carrier-protein] synthase II
MIDPRTGVQRRRVVVTGIGVASPLGCGVDAMWSRLLDGTSGVDQLTAFDASTFPTRFGAEVREFDERSGPADPCVRRLLNRKSRFGWAAACDAWRDSALTREASAGMGLAIGSERRGDDFLDHVASNAFYDLPDDHLRIAPFALGAALAATLGFEGPQLTVGTACASSAQAVGLAYQRIRFGEADLMLAGGCDSIDPVMMAAFSRLGALSRRNDTPAQASRPFDSGRDGFVLGEGAGMLVLEELGSAVRRGARIYGEIAGYGTSSNAYRITDSPADGHGIALAMAWALDDAAVAPEAVDYINAHGTSTVQNDASESTAIRECFRDAADAIWVSSTKSMTGHLINGCGALEAIVCLLAIRDGALPPTINLDVPDPVCAVRHVSPAAVRTPVRVALSNSCAFGGINAALVLTQVDDA